MTFSNSIKKRGRRASSIEKRRVAPFSKGVSSRKFIGKSNVDTPTTRRKSSSNSDFIVNSASGVKVLSSIVDGAAQSARQSLEELDMLVKRSVENDEGDERRRDKGTQFVNSDLKSLQKVFSDGILSKINSSAEENVDIKEMMKSSAKRAVVGSLAGASMKKRIGTSSTINRATPAIDYAKLCMGNRGSLDKFSVKLVFTVDANVLNEQDVKAFRIFRAKKIIPESTRNVRTRLSLRGIDEISSTVQRTRNKNFGKDVTSYQSRLDANGIDNMLSQTVIVDDITGNRSALTSASASLSNLNSRKRDTRSSDDAILKDISSFIDVKKISSGIDKSVAEDLKSMRNIQVQNPELKLMTNLNDIVGRASPNRDVIGKLGLQQIKNIREASIVKNGLVSNSRGSGYAEIATLPLSRLKKKSVDRFVEFSFTDETVEFGNSYSYYITSVDATMVESSRSRIIKMTVESVIPPKTPKRMTAKFDRPFMLLSILADDDASLVEKFEIYRKEENTNKQITDYPEIKVVNGKHGFSVEMEKRSTIDTGYVQVGETVNGKYGGSFFRDTTVVEGKRYSYRAYSVDIFGNKSQQPKIASVFANDGRTIVDLEKPTLMAEVDPKTRMMKVTMHSDDERIISLFLERKDLTTHERAFKSMKQPSHARMGQCSNPSKGCKTEEDVLMRSDDNAWNGHFLRKDGDITFIDKASRVDHTYQYRVYGVDRFGNRSPCAITQALLITRRAMVNEPVNVRAEFSNGKMDLTWDDANIDVDPETRIGNRSDFENNSVNTLFQVERKRVGQEIWQQFPLTEKNFLEDRVAMNKDEILPKYRPEFLEIDANYLYRVAVYQTGGFISNFSLPLRVGTFTDVMQPSNFRVKTCDQKCEPFYTALNWNTPDESGVVERWMIERAEVNNFAAATLNSSNVEDIANLEFEHINDVFRESSRSRSRIDDVRDGETADKIRKNKVLTAQHNYIDSDVRFGNTYFYRLTAFGLNDGNSSEPLIRGIKLSDAEFDSKLNAVTEQKERNRLSLQRKPLVMRDNTLRNHGDKN